VIVMMRSPRSFFEPLAVGAPQPLRTIPATPSRMIHFFDPGNQKMVAKLPALAAGTDVLLGNLEDAIESSMKDTARAGLIDVARTADLGATSLWARVNALHSPWALEDITRLVLDAGEQIDVLMIPKVEGREDIEFVDRLIAQLEARAGISRPLMLHAILETSRGVANVEAICLASPRMQGVSLGPADLAADRQMKTTAVGGGHPGYLVRADPPDGDVHAARPTAQQDLWHYTLARMVDACRLAGIQPYYGPFGDIRDVVACEDQFRNAYVMGCVGAWSLHPVQIDIARRVFTPDEAQVAWARRVLAALTDGSGAVMIDGKMQDDATFKQCANVVAMADLLLERDRPSESPPAAPAP
jgi:malyl-CoA/(S)-citramalyl-CoA lyase